MKKFISKISQLCALLALSVSLGLTEANAQVAVFTQKEKSSEGSPVITTASLTEACLAQNTAQAFVGSVPDLTGVTYTWRVAGGIEIVSSSGANVSVQPIIQEGRHNKGRLYMDYVGTEEVTGPPCEEGGDPVKVSVTRKGTAYVDLYQIFDYENTPIIGPTCVGAGDSVAYTVKDLVSGNINAGIGIDSYVWDFESIRNKLVGTDKKYYSGDSSAITFKFEYDVLGGEQLKVKIGRCNSAQVVKTLGRKLPIATLQKSFSGCIPTTTTNITITNTPTPGVYYQWYFSNNNFKFTGGTMDTTRAGISVDIGTEGGYILMVSRPMLVSPYCNVEGLMMDTIFINRSLADGVRIGDSSCITPGNTYTYKVISNPNVPVIWEWPNIGWTPDATNPNAASINVETSASAIAGTITVATKSCPNAKVTFDVNIRPGKPGPISGEAYCLPAGTTTPQTFTIDDVTPAAASYQWSNTQGWAGTSSSTSITLTPAGSLATELQVIALGLDGCNSKPTTQKIGFLPAVPGAITASTPCVNLNTSGTVTYSVTNVPGITYEWDVPSGLGVITLGEGSNSIQVTTNAVLTTPATTYEVKVRARNDCDVSAYNTPLSVTPAGAGNVTLSSEETYDDDDELYTLELKATSIAGTYQWTRDDAPLSEPSRTLTLVQPAGSSANYCVKITRNSTSCSTKLCQTSTLVPQRLAEPNKKSASIIAEKVQLFPNPVTDVLNVNISGKFKQADLKIVTLTGDEVLLTTLQKAETTLNLPLANGTYVVIVRIDGDSTVKKIIINK